MKHALYFGYGNGGHFLRESPVSWRQWLDPKQADPTLPWTIGLMDTGLLKNRGVPDHPDGRVHWTCGGRTVFWFAFFWWDHSGDARPGSNSGFYVRGFEPAAITRERVLEAAVEAFNYACGQWPAIIARQAFSLVLEGPPPSSRSGTFPSLNFTGPTTTLCAAASWPKKMSRR